MKPYLAFAALFALAGTAPAAVYSSSTISITLGTPRPEPRREVVVVQEPEPDVIVVREPAHHCPPRVVYVREPRYHPVVVYETRQRHHGYYERPNMVRRVTPWDARHEAQSVMRGPDRRDERQDRDRSDDRDRSSRDRGGDRGGDGDRLAEGPRGR